MATSCGFESRRPHQTSFSRAQSDGSLCRQLDQRAQASGISIFQRDIATVLARHRARDAEAETNSRFRRITRRIAPVERRKNLLLFVRRDSGPIVVDDDRYAIIVANNIDARAATIFDG